MGKNLLKSVKKRATRTIVPRGFDTKYIGEEPTFSGPVKDVDLGKCLNWYNYMVDEKQCRNFIADWMLTKDDYRDRVDELKRIPEWKFQGTVGALARMMTRGLVLDSRWMKRFRVRIDDILSYVSETSNVAQLERTRLNPESPIVAEIDSAIDEFTEGGCRSEWSVYDFLKARATPGPVAKRVGTHFSRLRDELAEAVKGHDVQLREAYHTYTKKQLRSFHEFVDRIVSDCVVWGGNIKKARAPRKKRVKTADQLTKRVKYLQQFPDLKLISVPPSSIVGARVLWTYNARSKALARYEWADGDFSIKGSTLDNYSIAGQKKLRKPIATLPNIVSGGPKAADKTFIDLKTKITQPNGRLNQHTVLLRVVKQ